MKLLLSCLLSLPLLAQVRFLPAQKLWVLETDRTTYVLGINEQNSLQNLYWGKRLWRDEDLAPAHTQREHASFDSRETNTNEEYPAWGASLHTLRHTHGSQLLAAGVPLTDVSKRLGHSNPHVTATIYAHALPGHDDLAAAAWEKFQKQAKPAKVKARKRA